uniref:GtrA-like protein n=1 Tax=Candidatus Kentrum sp. UNK TaxID=2126344 RepID=A0A451AY13_9GAMM|nr:MAG: GtrA-like protein [Candidatus Kentron sp. UNK]VFK70935.1 MAG: GtrA-like protein [Candidatus Kentron sp. UNK]
MIITQYVKFIVNGCLLGLAAWGLQFALFHLLGGTGSVVYAMSSLLTYVPLILMNFAIQRQWIFGVSGRLHKFVLASILTMLLVSVLSPLCRIFIGWIFGEDVADHGGFVLAALIGATPSFFLTRIFVFGNSFPKFAFIKYPRCQS